jgi:hypothetical protein
MTPGRGTRAKNDEQGITAGVAETTGRQYVLRVKSLVGYAHRLGYAPFNAGATIRVRSDARNRGATLAKRVDVLSACASGGELGPEA